MPDAAHEARQRKLAKLWERSLSPLQRRICVTLAVGGPTFLITEVVVDHKLWSFALSVFLGGITLVVQFLADIEGRLAGVEQGARNLANVNQANRLFDRLEASLIKGGVLELADRATQIRPEVPGLAVLVAQEEIKRVSRLLKDVGAGAAVSFPGEDRDWLLTLVANVNERIDATSSKTVDSRGEGPDGSFWKSDLGQRYLYKQGQAIGRGVAIRRIFIRDTRPELDDTEFDQMCRQQRREGIEIRVLCVDELQAPLNPQLFDFVLFDHVLSYETTSGPIGDSQLRIVDTRLELDADKVKERVSLYQALWEAAVPYQPLD